MKEIILKHLNELGKDLEESYGDKLILLEKKDFDEFTDTLVKKLTIPSVVVPKGTLCNCNSITTDEFRNGVNWRTCNTCGISRIA